MNELLFRIEKLENKQLEQALEISIMRSLLVKIKPDWADESLNAAIDKGLVDYPFMGVHADGSFDFYRIIDLLHKNELI